MREVGRELRGDAASGRRSSTTSTSPGSTAGPIPRSMLRGRFKVAPLEQWNVRREYLRRLKKAFDARGIEIPFPHLTVYAGTAKDGATPPVALTGGEAAARGPGSDPG